MSLAEKFKEYCEAQKKMFTDGDPIEPIFQKVMQRAFYAGAEATLNYLNLTSPKAMQMVEHEEIQAEIDHFRSHK